MEPVRILKYGWTEAAATVQTRRWFSLVHWAQMMQKQLSDLPNYHWQKDGGRKFGQHCYVFI